MTKEQLMDRINKAEAKINKKEQLIVKKNNALAKKYVNLKKLGIENPESKDWTDYTGLQDTNYSLWEKVYDNFTDIDDYKYSIKDAQGVIESTKKTIAKYQAQLEKICGVKKVHSNLPEVLVELENQLVRAWDAWDKENGKENHKANVQEAEAVVVDLYNRVKEITGEEITGRENITATSGTHGFTVLNGNVTGTKGTAKVESILAGGYHIQRLHIRVLVKEA